MNETKIQISEITKTISQEADSCSDPDEYQYMTIQTVNAGSDTYVYVSTKKFAVDNRDEWMSIFDRFIAPTIEEADSGNDS